MSTKVVCLVSGGMDSCTMLYFLKQRDYDVVGAIGFDYGQRHAKELQAAQKICRDINVRYELVDLRNIQRLLGGSSQTDNSIPVPDGHYAAENMKVTVVPNRNMIMMSVALGWAISLEAEAVAYAAHAGDHAIYPDCRLEFVQEFRKAAALCHYEPLKIITPFVQQSKADIARIGSTLGVPYQDTWTCYKGRDLHCGTCGTCIERREAFMLAGVKDPTQYEDHLSIEERLKEYA